MCLKHYCFHMFHSIICHHLYYEVYESVLQGVIICLIINLIAIFILCIGSLLKTCDLIGPIIFYSLKVINCTYK